MADLGADALSGDPMRRKPAYRVLWMYDPDPDLTNPHGSPLPGPEAEYTGNEIHALINPADDPETGARRVVEYAEYCRYWGNPERHTVLGCVVERQCPGCGTWQTAESLWNIDMMDDAPEIRGLQIYTDTGRDGRKDQYAYTPDEARALPGYLGEVACARLTEAGAIKRTRKGK